MSEAKLQKLIFLLYIFFGFFNINTKSGVLVNGYVLLLYICNWGTWRCFFSFSFLGQRFASILWIAHLHLILASLSQHLSFLMCPLFLLRKPVHVKTQPSAQPSYSTTFSHLLMVIFFFFTVFFSLISWGIDRWIKVYGQLNQVMRIPLFF